MQPRQQKQWKSWLLLAAPRYDWSQNLTMKEKKTAGFLKAKEKAIKCNGCNLNRACSFLMAPGCGQDIVLVDLMSGLSCGAEKCCELSLYLSLPGNSAAYVALTSLHCTREIQPSTWNEKKPIYLHTTSLCLPLLPLIIMGVCTKDASECRTGDPNKMWLTDTTTRTLF